MITQLRNNHFDYMIDPTFKNISRLFVISLKNGDNDPTRDSFDNYYMPLVDIIDFNALMDNKPLSDQLVKNKYENTCNAYEKSYEKLVEISRNNYYTTGN